MRLKLLRLSRTEYRSSDAISETTGNAGGDFVMRGEVPVLRVQASNRLPYLVDGVQIAAEGRRDVEGENRTSAVRAEEAEDWYGGMLGRD